MVISTLKLINTIILVASTAYQISQQNKMKREADKRKGFQLTISGQAVSVPVAYGKNALGGIEVKHQVNNSYTSATNNASKTFSENFPNTSKSGSKNEYLTVQYALCHEGIEGVQWVKVDGIDYNDNSKKFNHIIRTHSLGGVADAIATANNIDSSNRFTNTAYASATFKLNRDDYNYNGVPQMEFLVKGRKVKWVKELNGVYSLSTTSIYSNNPALCLLDYLINSRFGRGLSINEIDLESFYKSAAVCDTVVATERTVAGQVNNQLSVTNVADFGSLPSDLEEYVYEKLWKTINTGKYWHWNRTQWVETVYNVTRPIPLYECNLTLDTESNIRDNIERIMNTMGLAELTWSSEGKYKLLLEHPKTATELSNLVNANHYFTDNDIIRDDASLSWPSASSRLNQATINFLNEHEDFKEDTITWPLSYSAVHTQYLTEDNNQPFQVNIDADGITDPYHALAMAEQAVRKARSIFTLTFTVSKNGLNLEPGDFIKVSSDNLNISNEVFRVESIEVRGDFTVGLTCYKFDHEVLAWNVADDIAYTTRPVFDFSVGAPTNGVFTQGAEDNLGTASGRLSWTESDDIAVIDYLVEVSRDDKVTYQTLGVTKSTTFDVTGLKTGAYDFSIRGRTPLGGLSDRLEVDDETILLKTVGQVAVIYANTSNALTNTQSYNVDTNNFIAYYPYTSDLPNLPIRTGISFSKFIPEKEVDYFDGINGISIKLQYSVLGTGSWHDTFQVNDKYVRSGTLTPPDTVYVYGPAAKFVPELGVEYDDGIDGTSAYLHIAYADTSVGGGFSQSPTGKNYIGTYSDSDPVDSSNPGDYTWILTKGATGVTGASTNIIFQRLATQPVTPGPSSGIPNGWYDNPPSGTELIWASSGTKTAGSTTFTWGTPWQIDGTSIAEVSIYRKNSGDGGTGGTYNFVTNDLTPPSLWFVDPPALTADGDTIYRKSGVTSGSATQTSASVSYGAAVVYAKRVDGYTPVKGVDYFDGLGGVSVKLQYSVDGSTSWHDAFQTNDKYVRSGTLTPPATTYVYGAATKFVPEKGIEYDDGIPGTNAYLHIAYADTSSGGGFNQSPTNKEYIGTYSDSNPTDSTDPALYQWVLIKGADGYTPVKGVDYFDGLGGVSVKLQYSVNGSTSWHDTYVLGDRYVRSGTLTPPATTYVYGAATKFVPEKGVEYDDGIPGTNAYLHIAYADTSSGGGFNQSPTNKEYIGTYSDSNPTDSANPALYQWVLIKGADGYTPVKGVDYFDGLNGVSVKLQYSVNGSTSWHDTFQTNDKYIRSGTLTPPATTYVYGAATKFVPEKGVEYDDGIPGTNAYLHIAYADTSSGGGFSQSPTGKEYIGTYSDSNPTDSTNPALYQWVLAKGADGADGATGTRGAGWWRYETGSSASTAGLSSSTVTTYFTTVTGLTPVFGDKFVLTNTLKQANAYVYTTSWAPQAAFVDGNFLVNGTVTSDSLVSNQISTLGLTIGTLSSSPSGARLVLQDDKILVYDSNNIIRVKIGNLS